MQDSGNNDLFRTIPILSKYSKRLSIISYPVNNSRVKRISFKLSNIGYGVGIVTIVHLRLMEFNSLIKNGCKVFFFLQSVLNTIMPCSAIAVVFICHPINILSGPGAMEIASQFKNAIGLQTGQCNHSTMRLQLTNCTFTSSLKLGKA